MGRKVYLNDNNFVLKMTEVTWVFACKRTVTIPYTAIRDVYVENYQTLPGMARTLGTSIPPSINEGKFLYKADVCFLSYEHKVPLVHMELKGHKKYKHIIFEYPDNHDLLVALRTKIGEVED